MTEISAVASADPQKPTVSTDPAQGSMFVIKPKRGRPRKADSQKTFKEREIEKKSKRELLVERVRPAFYKYCIAIANGARAKEALAIAGVSYADITHGYNHSAELKQLLEDAKKERERIRIEEMHDEIYQRAVEGHDEPMVSAGRKVCTRKVRSDRLLELLYKCEHPEIFIHRVEGNLNITARSVNDLIDEIEKNTPIGVNKPTVFLGEGEAKKLAEGAIEVPADGE